MTFALNDARAGLTAAFLEHRKALERYLYRLVGDWALAEDLLHDTLVKLLVYKGDTVRAPKGLLFTTARRLVIDHWRKASTVAARNAVDVDALNIAADGPTPEEQLLAREAFQAFRIKLPRLPPRQRRVFALRRVYGLPRAAVAAELKISVSTMDKHLAKAVKALGQRPE